MTCACEAIAVEFVAIKTTTYIRSWMIVAQLFTAICAITTL